MGNGVSESEVTAILKGKHVAGAPKDSKEVQNYHSNLNYIEQLAADPGPLAAVTGILPTTLGGTGIASSATFPASGVVATQTSTETLSNKTLASPLISGSTPGAGKVLTSDATGLASWSTDGSALTNLNPSNLSAVVAVAKGDINGEDEWWNSTSCGNSGLDISAMYMCQ